MIYPDSDNSKILFNQYDLRSSLESGKRKLFDEVKSYPLSKDVTTQMIDDLADVLAQKYSIELPLIDREKIRTSSSEKKVDISHRSEYLISDRSRPFYKTFDVVTFYVPFSGEKEFFFMRASTFSLNPPHAYISDNEIRIGLVLEGDNTAEQVKAAFEAELQHIEQGLEWVRKDVGENYNSELVELARNGLRERNATLNKTKALLMDLGFDTVESKTTEKQPMPAPIIKSSSKKEVATTEFKYDFFISHASEDKDGAARPIFDRLSGEYRVWFDEAELSLGDSLNAKIEDGLAHCRFGIVILSPKFFEKKWTNHELNALTTRNIANSTGVIIPVWHDITRDELAGHHPSLADLVAANMNDGVDRVVEQIKDAYEKAIRE